MYGVTLRLYECDMSLLVEMGDKYIEGDSEIDTWEIRKENYIDEGR